MISSVFQWVMMIQTNLTVLKHTFMMMIVIII